MSEGQLTGDPIHPVTTRPTGVKRWVWLAMIVVLITVASVYMVGMQTEPQKDQQQTTGSLTAQTVADTAYRYAAKVTHLPTAMPRPSLAPSPSPAPSALAASPPAAPSGDPNTNAAKYVQRVFVPDVQDVGAQRVPHRRLTVVYGAGAGFLTPGFTGAFPIAQSALPGPAASTTATAPMAVASPRSFVLSTHREPPSSTYLVSAGSRIEAQLDVAVESDIPGPVVAHITGDVRDRKTGEILIPAGTWVTGTYGGTAPGQSQLAVTWERLVFPDQSSLDLGGMAGLGVSGQVGIGGRVDTHQGTMIRRSLVGGLLADIARRVAGTTNATNIVVVGGGVSSQPGTAQAIMDLVNQLNAAQGNLPPTIVIPQNAPVELYVERDLSFPDGPYAPMQSGGPH